VNPLDVGRVDVVVINECLRPGDAGVGEVTAGIVFDVDAVGDESPHIGIEGELVALFGTVEVPEPTVTAQRRRVSGKTRLGEASGDHGWL